MQTFKKTLIVCCGIVAFLIFMPIACAGGCAGCLAAGKIAQESKNKEATEKLQNLVKTQNNIPQNIVTTENVKQENEKPVSGPADTFGDGQFVVGVDIAPGRYRSATVDQDSLMPMCSYKRLKNFDGDLKSIIAINIVQKGNAIVTIKATDAGFESQGCVSWTKF